MAAMLLQSLSLLVLWCEQGPIPEQLLAEVARQVLQGLLYLHRQHVVHRDIKPSNLLINRRGQVIFYWLSSSSSFGVLRFLSLSIIRTALSSATLLY